MIASCIGTPPSCTELKLKTERPPRRIEIGVPDDIPDGTRKIVRIAGRSVGVFNQGGEFFALQNVCPHRGAPVCTGRLRPRIEGGDSLEFSYSPQDEVLKCPWHQWEFDLRSGRALHGDLALTTYSIEVEEDRLILYF